MNDIPVLIWDADQVGHALGITVNAVRNLHYKSKNLRGYKVGGTLRWRPSDVERFVQELGGDSK